MLTARIDARPLAVARIGVGVALLLLSVETHDILSQVAQGSAVAMPWLAGLPHWSPLLVAAYVGASALCAVGVLVGYRLPWTATASAVLSGVLMVWEQQTYSAHRTLFVLLCVYLAFSRADAAWAVRGRRAESVPFWPVLLMLSQVSVCYLFGALSKLNPTFLSGAVLEQSLWLPLPQTLLAVLPLLVVVCEVFIALGLWLPRLRLLAALTGLGLHVSIVATMEQPMPLMAFAAACLGTYPLFLLRPGTAQPAGGPAVFRISAAGPVSAMSPSVT